jgi:membrane protease YdiL (CAAX protease family)
MVVLRAIVVGLVVASLGTVPWGLLAAANLRFGSAVPWAVPAMAVILIPWWWYFVRGRGWPSATADARRRGARANPVPAELWGPALGVGILGIVGVLLLQGVLGRLVALPQQQDLDPSKFPVATVFAWVVMGALVAGIVEETAFRGYMQGGIERRHSPWIAILITGSLFSLAHFSHPEVGLVLLPYYVAIATVYGGLAYATNSTLPSIVLHAGGNILSSFSLFTQGRSEWQLGAQPPVLVWQTGVDAAFVANVVGLLLVSAGACFAYRALAAAGRTARPCIEPVASTPFDVESPDL